MRLLLDAHISPAVVKVLSAAVAGADVIALRDWHDGAYLQLDDDVILRAAHSEMRTLVTYDLRTIPPLLKLWAEQGIAHGGVVLVDERTVVANDVGGLVRALTRLMDRLGDAAWENRIVYLSK